jgi:tetratricopeptide (TPR) repeat protein
LDSADRIENQAQAQGGPILSRLLFCRTTALEGLGRTNEAAACLERFIGEHQHESEALAVAAGLYEGNRKFGEALAFLNSVVKLQPNDPKLLAMKGRAELELGKYDVAAATLTAALALAPLDDTTRLHRGIAYLAAGRLDDARADYEKLLERSRNTQVALFGLGAVAWRKHDTNAAIEFYRQYLSNGVPASVQYAVAAERLRRLDHEGINRTE